MEEFPNFSFASVVYQPEKTAQAANAYTTENCGFLRKPEQNPTGVLLRFSIAFIGGGTYTIGMLIPEFPEFVPIVYELRSEMHPQLPMTPDGVSEYTFANLFLFRRRYRYRVSRLRDKTFIISGVQPPHAEGEAEKKFFCTPCAVPGRGILEELFRTHDYWKGISDSLLTPSRDRMEGWGMVFSEDRDNFDYLYLRSDLADLPGKKYHKKRNLVSQFHNNYPVWEAKPLSAELVPAAIKILEQWRNEKGFDGDFLAASEALEKFRGLYQKGMVYWVEGRPAACPG